MFETKTFGPFLAWKLKRGGGGGGWGGQGPPPPPPVAMPLHLTTFR